MDGNTIKRIGLIATGSVIGGIVGYFLGVLILNQLENLAQQLKWAEEDAEAERLISGESTTTGVVTVREVTKQDYTKYAKEKGDLTELVKPYTSSIVEESKKEEVKSDRIMIISSEDYDLDRTHNKEPIAYYEDDTTFANAAEDIIDNPVSIFGPNIHLHFGEQTQDPDIVYVRNENNGVDYEISRLHNSYSVVVMGMPEEKPKETKGKRKHVRKVIAHDDEDKEDESED